jgi:4-hydroxybenzoate polyprenyltransferase
MNWNKGIRQTHRWLSIAFTITVIIGFVAVAQENPAEWLLYLPLPPLFLLLFTGLYLFVLPYLSKRRSGQPTE